MFSIENTNLPDFKDDEEVNDIKDAIKELRLWEIDQERKEQYRELYHGTTTKLLQNILTQGIQSPADTGNRNENRQVNLDVIFLTSNTNSALGYAGRAKNKYGGERVVLKIGTKKALPFNNKKGGTIFVAKNIDSTEILNIIFPDRRPS